LGGWFANAGACVWFLSTLIGVDDMNKIDLIIAALEYTKDCGKLWEMSVIDKALAAARELKALKPVGVFEYDWMNKVWEELTPNCEGVKLYALDEVTK
jgi:hypothetical protein